VAKTAQIYEIHPAGARSAPAGPIGTKCPAGPVRPTGPAGVLRRRLLHRNATFVPPAPPTRTRRRVKTAFLRKTGRNGPFFHQSGRFQGVERAKFRCRRSHLFGFSRRWPESGRFGRFSGPRGPKWKTHLLTLTQKERRGGRPECTQVTLFPYNYWVSAAKTRFGPVSGVPGPKRVLGNGRRPLGETTLRGRFCKNPENSNGWNERNFGAVAAVYPVFHVGGPKRAILALFWAPGGPGPIRKRQFGRHAKTAAENGSNPVRLLKCHVRREKGPTRGPGGPLVTGRGAHVSTAGKRSGAKTKH
jgi:hypothetical protein